MHCERWRRYGDPLVLVGKGRPALDLMFRFFSKVEKADDCWVWTGGIDIGGYGKFWTPTKHWRAHRFAYTQLVGPIPDDMTLDHVCHTNSDCTAGLACAHRRCVNPAHLEPISNAENARRGRVRMPLLRRPPA